MATCSFQGNGDMYGLGIRLGFYIQWFSSIFARWLVPTRHRRPKAEDPMKEEAWGLSFSNNIFSAATFTALVILISNDVESLQIVEIYIVLLLTFGYSLFLIPIYLWRMCTGNNPAWDPTRWPVTTPSPVESVLRFLLISAVAAFQIWFWGARVPQLDGLHCSEYGYLMTKVRLNLPAMRVINLLLYIAVLIFCLYFLFRWIPGPMPEDPQAKKRRKQEARDKYSFIRRRRKILLQNIGIVLSLVVAVTVVAATELTIKWNHIQGVNSLASAGQSIPFAIGVALFIRIWYVYLFKEPDPEGQEHRKPQDGDSDDSSWSPASSRDVPEMKVALSDTDSRSPGSSRNIQTARPGAQSPRRPPPARQRRRRNT
ncbi:hypothetical protein PV08_02280 [Exophiala spinifera]|uniref:Uncharacterized protein n=1 Tax=Exophiala spinifera TaxID=91928 RepID=A0A0D2C326_9EURO|nr:uncharacterized protein PV08_02280 [Exophiala spinifera]KIW17994.1 hypothetical protein PV08_02280 [Exophiala spinifera]